MITFNRAELAALERRLNELTEKVAKKAVRSAARKAMKKVRDEARANAPKDTGLLELNFGLLTKARDEEVSAKVGVRGGAKRNDSTPFYFRFQEFGTRDIPARPFLLPALENNAQDVLDTLVSELKAALEQA